MLPCLAMLAATAVAAQDDVPLPLPRPAAAAGEPPAEPPAAPPLPRSRPAPPPPLPAPPEGLEVPETPEAPETPEPADAVDDRIYREACPAMLDGRVAAQLHPPIAQDRCVARSPLALTALSVNGRSVPLSGEAIVSCAMAGQLAAWATAVDSFLAARENTGLERLLVGTSYTCRPRNGVAGAAISEHGFANALDIVGFELEDGRTMSLPGGWDDPLAPAGRLLRFAHGAACGLFTTTLGPEANAAHADHLHLDLGCHGAACTARLCE